MWVYFVNSERNKMCQSRNTDTDNASKKQQRTGLWDANYTCSIWDIGSVRSGPARLPFTATQCEFHVVILNERTLEAHSLHMPIERYLCMIAVFLSFFLFSCFLVLVICPFLFWSLTCNDDTYNIRGQICVQRSVWVCVFMCASTHSIS